MIGGYYKVENPTAGILQGYGQAAQAYAAMGKRKKVETEEGFSASDMLQTAMAGALVASEAKKSMGKDTTKSGLNATTGEDLEKGQLLGGVTPPDDTEKSGFGGFESLYQRLYGSPFKWGKS